MCINIMTHHGCFHPVFLSTKTDLECSDTIHPNLIHEYSEEPCQDCLDEHPERFDELSEARLISLFNTRCIDDDRSFLNFLMEFYKYHSRPGHECAPPHHCYEQSPERYYTYCRRSDREIARMPRELAKRVFGYIDSSDGAASPPSNPHVSVGKNMEGRDRNVGYPRHQSSDYDVPDVPDLVHDDEHKSPPADLWPGQLYQVPELIEADEGTEQRTPPQQDEWWRESPENSPLPKPISRKVSFGSDTEIEPNEAVMYDKDGYIYWNSAAIMPELMLDEEADDAKELKDDEMDRKMEEWMI